MLGCEVRAATLGALACLLHYDFVDALVAFLPQLGGNLAD